MPILTREIHRLCIPQIHGATSIQVFVHTGGAWDPSFRNTRLYTVSVDIIIGGMLSRSAVCCYLMHKPSSLSPSRKPEHAA